MQDNHKNNIVSKLSKFQSITVEQGLSKNCFMSFAITLKAFIDRVCCYKKGEEIIIKYTSNCLEDYYY